MKTVNFYFAFQAATKKQKYEKISEKKMSTPVEVLCKVNIQIFCFKCGDRVLKYFAQLYRGVHFDTTS